MKNVFYLILLTLLFTNISFSQEEEELLTLPEGLGISNQMKYSFDIDKKNEIFEDWFNLDYRRGIFSTGFRLDIFQPNDPNPAIYRGKRRFADLAFKYIKVELGNSETTFDITAGNYYGLFGRGLILKSYEDRNVRVDNNLLGLKINASYSDFYLTALSGMAENSNAERKDILHAVDLEYRGLSFLRFGGSFAANKSEDESAAVSQFASFRIQPSFSFVDFYAEYGIKQNSDLKNLVFQDSSAIVGRGFYGNANFYLEKFSLLGEYKYYDNFAFESADGTILYNTPPAVRKEYSYILLNRHPNPLNQRNEKGFQVESNYTVDETTYFNLSYSETKTLSANSYVQKIQQVLYDVQPQSERLMLREAFFQANTSFGKQISAIAAFGYNEELSTNTKNITPILELKYYFDEVNTVRLILEHQQTANRTTSEQYYDDVLTVEYLRSPRVTLSLVTEMQTKEPQPGRKVRRMWSFFQVGYKFAEHTAASILFGSRQAGNICIGGVCRYEPEFSGVELKLITRL